MDSNRILNIKSPRALFGNNKALAKNEYHKHLKTWHPDINKSKEAASVTFHIQKLWEQYRDGRETLYVQRNHDLGSMLIYPSYVEYKVKTDILKHIPNIKDILNKIQYSNDKFKREFQRYFPDANSIIQAGDTIRVNKPDDCLPLRDVLLFFKRIDPKHVAWIINGVLNNLCFLHLVQKMSFNGITIDNVFICPSHHTVLFIGGWWHVTEFGSKPKILPKCIFDYGYENCDIKSVSALALELLGDRDGVKLWSDKTIPAKMHSFLMSGSIFNNVGTMFKAWESVLNECFGSRKFVPMDLDPDKFYTTGGN